MMFATTGKSQNCVPVFQFLCTTIAVLKHQTTNFLNFLHSTISLLKYIISTVLLINYFHTYNYPVHSIKNLFTAPNYVTFMSNSATNSGIIIAILSVLFLSNIYYSFTYLLICIAGISRILTHFLFELIYSVCKLQQT